MMEASDRPTQIRENSAAAATRRRETPNVRASSPSVASALDRLLEQVGSSCRDAKLVVAILNTLTTFLENAPEDEFADDAPPKSIDSAPDPESVGGPRRRRRRTFLSKQRKDHLLAVINSLSDDEAAWYLGVGLRQIRRRVSTGNLYTFIVGGKRRYPMWQFGDRFHVLPGLRETIEAIPQSWPPERLERFMTIKQGPRIERRRVSPAIWLLNHGDPERIVKLLAASAQTAET